MIHLEERLVVMNAFQCWIYTGRLKDLAKIAEKATVDDYFFNFIDSVEVAFFADMHGIPALGNCAIDMYHEHLAADWKIAVNHVNDAYENTTKGSPICKVLVSSTVRCMVLTTFLAAMERDNVCAEFLLEALPLIPKRGENAGFIGCAAWTKMNRCQWHDHSGPRGRLWLESRKQKIDVWEGKQRTLVVGPHSSIRDKRD